MPSERVYDVEVDYDPQALDVEDSGCAQIYNLFDPADSDDDGMFVRIQSWADGGKHPEMDKMRGKKIRVIIEIS